MCAREHIAPNLDHLLDREAVREHDGFGAAFGAAAREQRERAAAIGSGVLAAGKARRRHRSTQYHEKLCKIGRFFAVSGGNRLDHRRGGEAAAAALLADAAAGGRGLGRGAGGRHYDGVRDAERRAGTTPKGDWPALDDAKFQKGEVAQSLVKAIKGPSCKAMSRRATTDVLLGQAGLAAQRADRDRIAGGGHTPLVVAQLEQQPGSVSILVTRVGVAFAPIGAKSSHRVDSGGLAP